MPTCFVSLCDTSAGTLIWRVPTQSIAGGDEYAE
jgi:hypothetical protein